MGVKGMEMSLATNLAKSVCQDFSNTFELHLGSHDTCLFENRAEYLVNSIVLY